MVSIATASPATSCADLPTVHLRLLVDAWPRNRSTTMPAEGSAMHSVVRHGRGEEAVGHLERDI